MFVFSLTKKKKKKGRKEEKKREEKRKAEKRKWPCLKERSVSCKRRPSIVEVVNIKVE